MPRPKEFEPAEALDAALHLFWQNGYRNTSMEDIVAHAGASRYGLYSVFGGKDDLYRAALDHYHADYLSVATALLNSKDAGLASIRAYFGFFLDLVDTATSRQGCFLCNSIVSTEIEPEIRAHASAIQQEIVDAFGRVLTNARRRRELAMDKNVGNIANYLFAVLLGYSAMTRAGMATRDIRNYLDHSLIVLA